MFLDLFCLLVTALNPITAKKGQALISRCFSGKCRYSMENDRYSLQVYPLLFLSGLSYNYIISPQISFGTLIWPSVSEHIDELIEALIEKKAPFAC